MHPKTDLAVIGSGGAAYAAAIRASTLGKSVVMVERGAVGGTCVNTGCVPSKALIAAAEALHVADGAARFPGITASSGPVDMRALIDGKQTLVETMRSEKYVDVADSHGWPVGLVAALLLCNPIPKQRRRAKTMSTTAEPLQLHAKGDARWIEKWAK